MLKGEEIRVETFLHVVICCERQRNLVAWEPKVRWRTNGGISDQISPRMSGPEKEVNPSQVMGSPSQEDTQMSRHSTLTYASGYQAATPKDRVDRMDKCHEVHRIHTTPALVPASSCH